MANEKVQINEDEFLKNLDKNKAAAKAAADAERPTGIIDDDQLLKILGIDSPNESIRVRGRVSAVSLGYAKNDKTRPYFQFRYNLAEHSPETEKGKGLLVSNYHEAAEGVNSEGEVWRTKEEAYERIYFEFQGLGETTKGWGNKELIAAAKKHTKNKTEVMLTLKCYEDKNDNLGMNVRVDPLGEASTEELEDNSTEESNEEEDGSYTNWVGGWVTWTDDEGSVDFLVESYDEDDDAFHGKDADGEEYGPAPTDQCEWAEDQHEK